MIITFKGAVLVVQHAAAISRVHEKDELGPPPLKSSRWPAPCSPRPHYHSDALEFMMPSHPMCQGPFDKEPPRMC